ncbi:probable 28S rRNA (cytosine-C(5))-methyltransferase [Notothenia coriiceps]|uniref:Probable 28S rRNA (Cytosine-C(5))-methyltransferase n=1 Tax=Notothenia coriiceps TaxID=8208 RepID=A0A6I9P5X9_9TELE|nr:PREDICTED: probable 28S rRNA (cytosine-C(5))-methyltransferase [Notothenia coriiceps]
MGRKLDPTTHVKKGPGRKSRKQKGAEIELASFIPEEEATAKRLSSRSRKRAAKRVLSKKAPKDAAKEKPKKGLTDEKQ